MQGATFTISSLGGIGGTSFTPIVNAPEVAILGVTRSAMKPVWNGSEFVPRLMVPLSLSYDHRVIDGALAARFVAHLANRAHRPAEGAALMEVKVPDIGDFADVPVIEVLVAVGRRGRGRGPARRARVRQGDDGGPVARGRQGHRAHGRGRRQGLRGLADPAARGRRRAGGRPRRRRTRRAEEAPSRSARLRRRPAPDADVSVQVAVLGAGPGGYTAAFRAADLGLQRRAGRPRRAARRRLPERRLHPVQGAAARRARCIAEAEELGESGVTFGEPKIDLDKVREWKNGVVGRLTGGLEGLAKQRKVQVVRGDGEFTGAEHDHRSATRSSASSTASSPSGSEAGVAAVPARGRRAIIDSTGALEVDGIPERLLVIGGGIIGLEMATVYDALGSKVTVVELLDQLIPGGDKDLDPLLHKRIEERYEAIHLKTGVESVEARDDGLTVKFGEPHRGLRPHPRRGRPQAQRRRDRRRGGGRRASTSAASSTSDLQMRTNVPHIFSIGDVVGEPMLAHKATHEGKVAAEVIAGEDVSWDVRSIPTVAYTDPEVAWTGPDRDPGQGRGHRVREGRVPVGGVRPRADAWAAPTA